MFIEKAIMKVSFNNLITQKLNCFEALIKVYISFFVQQCIIKNTRTYLEIKM